MQTCTIQHEQSVTLYFTAHHNQGIMERDTVPPDKDDGRPAWLRMESSTTTHGESVGEISWNAKVRKLRDEFRNVRSQKTVSRLLGVRSSRKHASVRSSKSLKQSVAASKEATASITTMQGVPTDRCPGEAVDQVPFLPESRQPYDDTSWLDSIRQVSDSGKRAYESYAQYLERCRIQDPPLERDSPLDIPSIIYVIKEEKETNEEVENVDSVADALNKLIVQMQSGDPSQVILDGGLSVASSLGLSLPSLSLDPEGQLAELSVSLTRMASVVETPRGWNDDDDSTDEEERILDKLETIKFH